MRKVVFLTGMVLLLMSCTSQKKLTYLRSVDASMADSINSSYVGYSEPLIKEGDELLIYVSSLDPEAAAPYNLPTMTYMKAGTDEVATTNTVQTYQVDKRGMIIYPVLGELQVGGKTKEEVRSMLYERLSSSLKDPVVTVKFLNYSVTVMGEVMKPGKYDLKRERVTIFDALAAAGDMTSYGKRNNVLVTRETNGRLEFARLNLNNADIFSSPYYYMQQNDVVYVEPNNVRAISSQNIGLYLSMLTSLGSMATVIVSVISLTK